MKAERTSDMATNMPAIKTVRALLHAISVAGLLVLGGCGGSGSGPTHTGGQTGYTNSNLKGTYTFLAMGSDMPSGNQYEVGGVLTADGNGMVTGGEQTYSDSVGAHADKVTGTYLIGSNGLGTITLQTGDSSIGVNGTETFSVLILSPSSGLISQFDTSATSSGSLDLQTSTAMPTAGYAFSVLAIRVPADTVLAFGGVFNIDNNPSTGSISGAGSVTDLAQAGSNQMDLPLSGSVSVPDAMGKITVQLTAGFAVDPIRFDGYIIDATRIQLVENDGFASAAGTAYGQGSATGSYTTPASFTGTYVFGFTGYNFVGTGSYAGVITSNGAGSLTGGQIDQVQGSAVISDTLTGTYANDASGTGRITTSTSFGNTQNGAGPTMIFYFAGAGNPVPVLQMDTTARSAGVAYVQGSSTPSLSGTYGVGYTSSTLFSEDDVDAAITASAGNFSGTANENMNFVTATNQSISGTFSAGTADRFTATVTTNGDTAACAFYLVDSTRAVLIETDGNQSTLGTIRQQVAP
jgi:hypothetical protein